MKYTIYIIALLSLSIAILGGCGNSHSEKKQSRSVLIADSLLLELPNIDNTRNKSEVLQKVQTLTRGENWEGEYLSKIAFEYLNIDSIQKFKKINNSALSTSIILKDSLAIADAHWNFGNFYLKEHRYDSSYYHYNNSYDIFEKLDKTYYSGKMLINMSIIRGRLRDYGKSEALAVRAIRKFEKANNEKSLYASYSHLGVLSKEIGEFNRAIDFHLKARTYIKSKDIRLLAGNYNNLGIVYQRSNRLREALEEFNKAKDLVQSHPLPKSLRARVIDNLAYTKYLIGDTIGIYKEFQKALTFRNDINNTSGIIISNLHIADYTLSHKDTAAALQYGRTAYNEAKKIKNNRDIITSLLFLKKAKPNDASQYYEEIFLLNNELLLEERTANNVISKIDLEIDEYKFRNQRLSSQRTWIILISILLTFIGTLLFYLRGQRVKNKMLNYEIEKQEAEQELLNFRIDQQRALEEVKQGERNRFSEELHDGILGDLCGVRLGLGFMELEISSAQENQFKKYLCKIQDIENNLRNVSHDLKSQSEKEVSDYSLLLSNLLIENSKIGDFQYDLEINPTINWNNISIFIKLNIYRILQETIHNIIKHARATKITIKVEGKQKRLILTVIDNGVGFDLDSKYSGIGLINMASRAKKIGGTLHIDSKKEKGSRITLTISI